MAYRTFALYQRQDVQAALVASCMRAILVAPYLRAIPMRSQGPELAGFASCLPPPLPVGCATNDITEGRVMRRSLA